MADRIRTEELQLKVLIDGSPARKELAMLDGEAAKINASLRDMKRGTEEYVKANQRLGEIGARQKELREQIGLTGLTYRQLADELRRLQIVQRNSTPNSAAWVENQQRINEVKNRMRELTDVNVQAAQVWDKMRQSIRLADMSMEQLEAETRRLNAAMRGINPNTAEFRNLHRELDTVNNRMAALRSGMGPFGRMWADIKSNVVSGVAVIGAMFAGGAIVAGFRGMVQGSAKLSDELANIQKATGMTKSAVEGLNASFGKINTRTANSALREIAVGLGQAGQEVTTAAVAAVDRINVALGDEFGTNALEISRSLTTLRNNLGDIKSEDFGADIEHIGNALNVLGAEGLATAPVVTDVANRIAGVATSFGVTSGEILGTAATFQELGITAERGSTAYIRLMQRMIAAPQEFGQVVKDAGGNVSKFYSDINNNAQAALVTFSKSVRTAGTDNAAFAKILKDLDTDGAGVSELLNKLGQNASLLAEKTRLATESLKSTSSITQEFNTKNTTLAANLEKIGKALYGAFVNSSITSGINSIVGSIAKWISIPLSEKLEEERISMNKTFAQMLSYNEGSKERSALIRQLQEQYPGFLANMDAEKVTTEQLRMAVSQLNKELVNKIILQQKDEEIQAQIEDQAEQQMRVLRLEDDLREKMIEQVEKYNLTIKEGMPLLDQALDIQKQIAEIRAKTNTMRGGRLVDSFANYGNAIYALSRNYNALAGEERVSNKLAQEREELMRRLGIATVQATANAKDFYAGIGDPFGERKAEPRKPGVVPVDDEKAKKLADDLKRFEEELKAHRERMLQINLTSDEQEIRQLDVKHAEERAKLKANKLATKDDLVALERAQERERINLIEQQGERRLKVHAEVEQMITDALREGASERLKLEAESWDERIAAAKARGEDTSGLQVQRQNAILAVIEDEKRQEIRKAIEKWDTLIALAKKHGIDTAALEEAKGRAINAITKKWEDKGVKDTEEAERAKRAARVKSMQEFGDIANSFAGVLDSLQAMQQAAHEADGVRTQQEMKDQRDLALVILAVKAAAAIATGVAQAMELPYPANIVAALSTAATVFGLIAQARQIMNSARAQGNTNQSNYGTSNSAVGPTDVPLGEQGTPALPGRSHAEGGMNVVDPVTGQVVYNIEGGEAVVNKDVTKENPALINAMMIAARRSDKRVRLADVMSPGNMLAMGTPAVNTQMVRRTMQVVHMGAGGLVHNGVTFSAGTGATNPSGGGAGNGVTFSAGTGYRDNGTGADGTNAALLKAIEEQNRLLKDMATRKVGAELVLSHQTWNRPQADYERLRNLNRVKRAA